MLCMALSTRDGCGIFFETPGIQGFPPFWHNSKNYNIVTKR